MDRNGVIKNVRSLLISVKGSVSVKQLENDYGNLIGERIPYSRLGYPNLISFLQSEPSLILNRNREGIVTIDARPSQQSSHISSMVNKQKAVSKKKPLRFNSKHRVRFPSNWDPKRQYQAPQRLKQMDHNQFISRPPPKAKEPIFSAPPSYSPPPRPVSTPPPPLPPRPQSPSSPLINTKKRLSKLMSEMDLERDSGNSSPTCENGGGARVVQSFVATGDPVEDLKSFVRIHKLGEIHTKFSESISIEKRHKIKSHHCKIQVGDGSYTSYPDEFKDRQSAERVTCQKALDDLIMKQNRRRSLLISTPDDIIRRIPPMLEKYMSAVWMWQITLDYIDMYNEQLPANWLQIVDCSEFVYLEKQLGGHVLRYCQSGEALQKAVAKTSPVRLKQFEVSVPCNTVQCDNDVISAIVTSPMSPGEIWCQQIGTRDYEVFIEMSKAMNAFYNDNGNDVLAKDVNAGSCYVISHNDTWVRVRALTPPSDGQVNCFLIDYGDDVLVATSAVYYLKRDFATSQAQAFVCRLVGLEDLYAVTSDSLELLKSKEVDLKIVENEISDMKLLTLPVVMYEKGEGININEGLATQLNIEAATPILHKDSVTEVYVSNICDDGEMYVQVRGAGYADLMEMLDRLGADVDANPRDDILEPITPDTCNDRLYLVKSKTLQKWQRASVLDWCPKFQYVQFDFIDVGLTEIFLVTRDVIYPLDALDDVINQYPPQAIKVRMMIETIPPDFIDMATKWMPLGEKLMLKIVRYDNEQVAWVEFFKKSTDGMIVFINKSISMETELLQAVSSKGADDVSNKRLMNLVKLNENSMKKVPSGGSLSNPEIPKSGEYFDVSVPFAVSPWNFFVQPLSSENELKQMMDSLQKRYQAITFSPMRIEDILPGNIYASKYEDGLWYRTSVLKVIHPGSISVFYCDYGYYANLSVNQLVTMDTNYMTLPYQAIKAKLALIKPLKNKWSVDDCDLFKSLVLKRSFVSVVEKLTKDELYPSDFIIELHLIDTSTDADVNIKDELISKGIAIVE